VALAAAANLVALFVYHYEMPSWLRRSTSPSIPMADASPAPETQSYNRLETGEHLAIPLVPVNYSGEADLDGMIMDDVYVVGADGQPIDEAVITYEILPADEAQKKTIRYTAEWGDGQSLTEERVMNLTTRYTGPTITLLGVPPGIDPGFADSYVTLLGDRNIIYADDGFGNDATDQVLATFVGLSDEEPDAEMKLSLENQVHDTTGMELTVHVKDYNGIVLVLTDYNITLTVGDDFDPLDYVDYAHDEDGDDRTDSVRYYNYVDTSTPGDYYVELWVWNSEGTTYSPSRFLYVTVLPETEEAAEAGDTP
jgi:hypothetical protein